MYINMLDNIGTITNKEKCIASLKLRSKVLKNISSSKIGFNVNANHSKEYRYFTKEYQEVTEGSSVKKYLWVNSGYKDKNKCFIYIQFTLNEDYNWIGELVGSEDEIIRMQTSADKRNNDEENVEVVQSSDTYSDAVAVTLDEEQQFEEEQQNEEIFEPKSIEEPRYVEESKDYEQVYDATSSPTGVCVEYRERNVETCFLENLYDKLLIKEGWGLDSYTLRNYLDSLISKLNYNLRMGIDCSRYLVYNSARTKVLFNTALLDKFGKSIVLITSILPSNELSGIRLYFIDSKSMITNWGFPNIVLKDIERVRFYSDSVSELVFDGDISDFDLESWDRLSHCVTDRRDRFPEEYRNFTPEVLCRDMVNAIELGVKLSKFDFNYIKPMYNRKQSMINFLIPYHVGNNFQKKPELGIIIAKFADTNYWQIMTVVDYEKAYSDAKVLSLYSTESF